MLQTDSESLLEESALNEMYFVSSAVASQLHRALPYIVGSRRCNKCQGIEPKLRSRLSEADQYIRLISEHCKNTEGYLTPNRPLKESIFRLILAQRNRPITPSEISVSLSKEWALTPFPRDLAPVVIQRLLESSDYYCIDKVTET